MFHRIDPVAVAAPRLIALNESLAEALGLDAQELKEASSVEHFAGNTPWPASTPLALAYAGHQFGGFSGQLGDGRAHLIGEVISPDGDRFDLQLKGSGPTPYARGGDGRSALGPVLREYLVSEWMHTVGVPTTRALAAVATGEPVYRETELPGGILTRVASSHLRVGSFEFLAMKRDVKALEALVDYALERHFPDQEDGRLPALRLLDCVVGRQAALISKWMGLGFVHGVMNTDNCTISGETIDYGPCAFIDSFEPNRKFSSIDRGGRYAFDQQAKIANWNLARLAEALLPLIGSDEAQAVSAATDVLHTFPERYERNYGSVCQDKLGLEGDPKAAIEQMTSLFRLMAADKADFTLTFRSLYHALRSDDPRAFVTQFKNQSGATEWFGQHKELFQASDNVAGRLEKMRLSNPWLIPRNHRIEEAIAEALCGDDSVFHRLRKELAAPFEERDDAADLASPPGTEQWSYVTFCGT